ncbi:hypothetical protein C1H46_031037 [Malus baccata]|uniref:Uncharacterized protein n=1 Tax=Malus baccata TaxID=106549 RepID=A0A540LAU8_MALBA|nr:hypothetical protein C1H46_031037 [Malus baccata]
MPCLPETLLSINDDHFDCLSDSLIINEIDDVNDLSVDDPDSFAADNNILDQSDITHHSPNQVLKNYNEIRFLRIELPSDELGIDDRILLNRGLILAPPYTTGLALGAAGEAIAGLLGIEDDDCQVRAAMGNGFWFWW